MKTKYHPICPYCGKEPLEEEYIDEDGSYFDSGEILCIDCGKLYQFVKDISFYTFRYNDKGEVIEDVEL